jgi:hypothetical protein
MAPAEGDRVDWPLQWTDDPSGPGGREVAWRAARLGPGVVLRHGPLTAWWPEADREVPARGALVADLHGLTPAAVPSTAGRVVRVCVVEQTWRLVPPRTYVPVPGAFVLRPVRRGPSRFLDDRGDGRPAVRVGESGVLVGLRLAS